MLQNLLHNLFADNAAATIQDPASTLARIGLLLGSLSLVYAWRLWVLREQSNH